MSEIIKQSSAEETEKEIAKVTYKKRRRRLGDRSDGRKLRTLQPMNRLMPYIMKNRSDAQNTFADKIEVSKADALCRQKVLEGKTNFSFLHVLLERTLGCSTS